MFGIYICRNFSAGFKNKLIILSTVALGIIMLHSCQVEETAPLNLSWVQLPDIPPAANQREQIGLAGALIGIDSQMLVVAGGSNFPDTLPWQGGTKTYYDDIYLYNLQEEDSAWQISNDKLPLPMAYPACISLNNKIISIGGENQEGLLSTILQIEITNNNIQIGKLNDFPEPVSHSGAATIGSIVYVAGGIGPEGCLSSFYCADILKNNFIWEKLPNLPQAISNAVVVSQWDGTEDCIYVLGGRSKDAAISNFFSSVWKYSPSRKVWQQAGDITNNQEEPLTLAAGTGVALGKNYILLLGGDNGTLYNKTEAFIRDEAIAVTPEQKAAISTRKKQHLETHPGFSNQVIVYNTITKKCIEITPLPFHPQVTTTAVKSGNKIFIPAGEIKPGIRTPKVNVAELAWNNQQ